MSPETHRVPAAGQAPDGTPPPSREEDQPPFRLAINAATRYFEKQHGLIHIQLANETENRIREIRCTCSAGLITEWASCEEKIRNLRSGRLREIEFTYKTQQSAGPVPLRFHIRCETHDEKTLFFVSRHRINFKKAHRGGGYNPVIFHGDVDVVGHEASLGLGGADGRNDPPNGEHVEEPEPNWYTLDLEVDDDAYDDEAHRRGTEGKAQVVPSARHSRPTDVALLSSRVGGCTQRIVLCSRRRIPFGADREGRDHTRLPWPPPVSPDTPHNFEELYRKISRKHGEFIVDLDRVEVAISPECLNGLEVDGRLLTNDSPGPVELRLDGSKVVFPYSGVAYQSARFSPHQEGDARQSRVQSLTTLGEGGAGTAMGDSDGVLGIDGFAEYDAVRLCRLPNTLQEGVPDSHDTLLILVREARIGSSERNAIVIDGEGVERVHAAIIFKGQRYWLQDLSSEAGITRIGHLGDDPRSDRSLETKQTVELFDGARITLGSCEYHFQIPDNWGSAIPAIT
ncbi:MAG: FHA domain-containing protein [Candidatus Eisenbacteria sp.]|nr:FHA domain-containing protein [Candidatus Eisenbacteria bacterium]